MVPTFQTAIFYWLIYNVKMRHVSESSDNRHFREVDSEFRWNLEKYELNTYDSIRNGFMGMDPLEDILPFGPFRTFYEDADRDFYVGGLIESEQEGDLGELFSTIILEQFLRLRDSGESAEMNGYDFGHELVSESTRTPDTDSSRDKHRTRMSAHL